MIICYCAIIVSCSRTNKNDENVRKVLCFIFSDLLGSPNGDKRRLVLSAFDECKLEHLYCLININLNAIIITLVIVYCRILYSVLKCYGHFILFDFIF